MFSSIRGLLIDVTGVLYDSGTTFPIAGSLEALALLRTNNIPFRIVSNESQCSTADFLLKLHRLGYTDLKGYEVFLPAPAAAKYLREHKLTPYLVVHPHVACEFEEFTVKDGTKPDSVLIGDAAEHFTFEKINEAFNILIRSKDAKLLTLGYGRYYKHGDGLNLDVGPYVEALRFAVGQDRVQPLVFGKPSPNYFNSAISDLNLTVSDCAMIGDDVNSDIGGAIKCGMKGILVRTGKYTPGDEIGKEHPPTAVVDNFLAAVKLFLDGRK